MAYVNDIHDPTSHLIITDIRRINRQSLRAVNSGMIILGGGVTKHHTCNANLMVCVRVSEH